MNFQIDLARQEDEQAIRKLLRDHPVPGRISVTYEREPNYFAGCDTMGNAAQTLVARASNGHREIAGIACRTTRQVFVNGEEMRIGYLGQLRIDKRFRGRWLVSRGFDFLRQLHEADPVPAYLVSIIENNSEATGVLVERRRKHFPIFHELGRLFTLALMIGRPKPVPSSDISLSRVTENNLHEVIGLLQTMGTQRQFFPVWKENDFVGSPSTLGFGLDDFAVANKGGRIVGVIGLWNQTAFKQTIVRRYNSWMALSKPVYNTFAPLLNRPQLPRIGQEIKYAYASFICIANNDHAIFRALLREIYNRASARNFDYLMVGLMENDPLLPCAHEYSSISYPSRIYLASWDKENQLYERLDSRFIHLEIATL